METANLKAALTEQGLNKQEIDLVGKLIDVIKEDNLLLEMVADNILELAEYKKFKNQITELAGSKPAMKPMKKVTPKKPAAKKPVVGKGLSVLLAEEPLNGAEAPAAKPAKTLKVKDKIVGVKDSDELTIDKPESDKEIDL